MTRVLNLNAGSLSKFSLVHQSSPKYIHFVKSCMHAHTKTNLQNSCVLYDDKELNTSKLGIIPQWDGVHSTLPEKNFYSLGEETQTHILDAYSCAPPPHTLIAT
jgi:hypothetical protein